MKLKRCPICKLEKDVETGYTSYYSKSRGKRRIANYCKPCAKEQHRIKAAKYYEENREKCKIAAKAYREDPKNHEKIKTEKVKFKKLHRENLADCYVRGLLSDSGISIEMCRQHPALVDFKRVQLILIREIKKNENI